MHKPLKILFNKLHVSLIKYGRRIVDKIPHILYPLPHIQKSIFFPRLHAVSILSRVNFMHTLFFFLFVILLFLLVVLHTVRVESPFYCCYFNVVVIHYQHGYERVRSSKCRQYVFIYIERYMQNQKVA